jgi:hypothetical protein
VGAAITTISLVAGRYDDNLQRLNPFPGQATSKALTALKIYLKFTGPKAFKI